MQQPVADSAVRGACAPYVETLRTWLRTKTMEKSLASWEDTPVKCRSPIPAGMLKMWGAKVVQHRMGTFFSIRIANVGGKKLEYPCDPKPRIFITLNLVLSCF